MLNGPLVFALLIAGFMALIFAGFWRFIAARDLTDNRLQRIGALSPLDDQVEADGPAVRKKMTTFGRMVYGFGLGPRLARSLSAANLSLTAAEFVVIVLVAAGLGFMLGWWRGGYLLGAIMGAIFGYLPIFYLGNREKRRKISFAYQLPEVLTLLVGAMRAGHGITQAMNDLTEQMPPPASQEFGQVVRAINLGMPMNRALNDLATRIGTGDIDLIVTAIVVQNELGGNLATTLETISETIKDRIRMKREIRVLTSQQRLTGGVLGLAPVALAVALSLLNPGYMKPFLEPGWVRILPIAGIIMMFFGFIVIRKIMDIEV